MIPWSFCLKNIENKIQDCFRVRSCNTYMLELHIYTYGTGKTKRLSYLVGNLVATNWPIEKALHAIGYNQIPTK